MKYSLLNNSSGFGFIGLLAIVLAVSIGGGLVYVVLTPSVTSLATGETVAKAKKLREGIVNFKANRNTANPTALTTLVTDDLTPCTPDNTPASATYLTLQGWCGPYVDQELTQNLDDYRTDGWKTLFQYNNATGVITSCGPDLACSTGDDLTFSP